MKRKVLLVLGFTTFFTLIFFSTLQANTITTNEIPGDLNGDGFVNTSDYVLLRRYLLGIGNISSNADVNADGAINSMDYVYVRQYILGIIDSFPGEDDEDLAKLFEGIQLATSYKDFNNHNPIMTHRFGADPYALVYEDRVYVYSTHDIIHRDSNGMIMENDYSQIRTLNRLSSEDLVNWTDHGVIEVAGPSGKAQWADKSWAPAAIYKNIDGKDRFFIYFANNANGVGVLTGDNPVGPFTDPIGRPLVSRWTPNIEGVPWLFDPAVIIDDNGTGYLYFGGGVPEGKEAMPGSARVVKLSEDMISLAGIPEVVEAPYFFEAAFVNKIGDTYYYSYCSNWADRNSAGGQHKPSPASIAYMTSKNPMGPWEYRGEIFENPGYFFGVWGNNHHSIIEFKGKWYLFYHTEILRQQMGIPNGYRCTHIDELEFNEDGTIKPVIGTRKGIEQVGSLNPYQINEAETMAWSGGISTRRTNEPSYKFGPINMVVSDMSTGSFIGLAGVDFGLNGPDTFTAKVASVTEGNVIKIVVGNINGEAIGYLKVPNTGSLDRFEEVTIRVKNVTGKKDLFFIFAGDGFYFDAWRFE